MLSSTSTAGSGVDARTRDLVLSVDRLHAIDTASTSYAVEFVDHLLQLAVEQRASDVHIQPIAEGITIDFRLNGVLHCIGDFPIGSDSDPVVRLKVLADLLTYKTQAPQEGRLAETPHGVEMRLSTYPTIHGERAVLRLFSSDQDLRDLSGLELPDDIAESLQQLCDARDGAVLVTGPAGSGKTTTLYAGLRNIAAATVDRRSVLTIEDPVESAIDGISQSQLEPSLGMTLDAALRSMLRQDPEVVMVGEIRDPATAEAALQASLTGHLVFSSFHAGNVGAAIRRLVEMKIAPYLIRSGVRAIVSQRLVRRLCECRTMQDIGKSGLPVDHAFQATGCDRCHQTGYIGRLPIAELLRFDIENVDGINDAIDRNLSASQIYQTATAGGMISLRDNAIKLVNAGVTSASEVHRVLGPAAVS